MEESLTKEQKEFPIWLVGDSYPNAFVGVLDGPLDPRHPTRHTIWTPIWDALQESVYPRRVDGEHLFICNAAKKGELSKDFNDVVVRDRIAVFSNLLKEHNPPMVLCFGAWAYEFARRADDSSTPKHSTKYWSVPKLGDAFRESCERFQPNRITIFPLLHQTVALQWEKANVRFVPENSSNGSRNNYFKYAGRELAKLLETHADFLKVIWLRAQQT